MTRDCAVEPLGNASRTSLSSKRRGSKQTRAVDALVYCYNWTLWGFLAAILFAQVFGIFWTVMTSEQHLYFGRDPLKGAYLIQGYNDEPYSDRVLACALQGRLYKPVQVRAALDSSKAVIVDTTGFTFNGYRVCARDKLTFDPASLQMYSPICDTLVSSLEEITSACSVLGYNVTQDALRVVDDVHSSTTTLLQNSLPVLIMPYWDYTLASRFVIPGWDGSACMFRLSVQLSNDESPALYFRGINRTVREEMTAAWLDRPGGVWRNGWYEDGSGMRWYSDVISLNAQYEHTQLIERQFDLTDGAREVNWQTTSGYNIPPDVETWGELLSFSEEELWFNSVTISNGSRFGLFLYEAETVTSITSSYSLTIFVSNLSLGLLLSRWLIAIITLQRANSPAILTGIGCLSSLRFFILLPILLLPRLKTTLAAFFVVGCQFEGEQKALAEAWFIVYPAIGELVLFYFSLINLIAKLLGRRVSDLLFGPTLAFFYFMHLFRLKLAQSGWLEFDGRIATVILPQDFDALRLSDFFTTDAMLRMNGNIKSLFTAKMVVFALNLVPFLWSTSTRKPHTDVPPLEIEITLAVRAATIGGLGRPFHPEARLSNSDRKCDVESPALLNMLSCYELIRLGYLVLGDQYLISIQEWCWLTLLSPLRNFQPFANFRVCVFLISKSEGDGAHRIQEQPRFINIGDIARNNINCRDISLQSSR